MRIFGKYVSTRYVPYNNNGGQEQQSFVVITSMILLLTCFSVLNPTFFLFWIPIFIAYPTVKKFLYKKDRVKKERDYE